MGTSDKKANTSMELSGKTKGKRSKLSHRRPASQKDHVGGGAGGEVGLLVNNIEGNDGLMEDTGVQHNTGNHHNQSNNIFNQVGSDPMGLNTMGLDASPDGGLMQQGSPTLLSALKGSSLRASAYGQDFSTSFKDDDMSLLGDFKNAAQRFSLNALGVPNDGLTGEGDLGSDSLWSSFPVDVDSLLPSQTPVSYGDLSGPGARYDMAVGEMGGADDQGQAGPSGANGNGNEGRVGGGGRIGGGGGGDESDMFRSASSQYFFQLTSGDGNVNGSGGSGNGNGNNGSGQQSLSNGGGMSFDSSYGSGFGMQQQQHDNSVGVQMGPGAQMRGAGGAGPGPGPGPGQMQQMQIQMQPNGQMAFNGQQQQQQGIGSMNQNQQMRPMRYFVPGPGGQGQQQMGYMQMPYHQQPMQGGMMIQQPYQYTQMVQPGQGQQQQQQAQGVGKGAGANSGGQVSKGGRRQGASNKQKTDDKRKASKGNEHNGMQQPVDMGGSGMSAPPGAMMAGQMVQVGPTGPYSMQPMQAMQVQQMRTSGSPGLVYQQHPGSQMGSQGSGPGMMMHQPGPRMYSVSSSVSTSGSGNGHGHAMGAPGGGNMMGGGGQMMIPPYIMNNMPMGLGGGGNGPNGHMHPNAGGAQGGMGLDEAGLAELETIVAKLDKPTMSNIKESLYRLARSARIRGVRSGDGGAQGHPPSVTDKAKSLVDKCVANLLYHRYTDMPTQGPNMQQSGQQQQINNNNNANNNNDDDNNGVRLTGPERNGGGALEQGGLEQHPQAPGSGQQRVTLARPNSMANVVVHGRHGSA